MSEAADLVRSSMLSVLGVTWRVCLQGVGGLAWGAGAYVQVSGEPWLRAFPE